MISNTYYQSVTPLDSLRLWLNRWRAEPVAFLAVGIGLGVALFLGIGLIISQPLSKSAPAPMPIQTEIHAPVLAVSSVEKVGGASVQESGLAPSQQRSDASISTPVQRVPFAAEPGQDWGVSSGGSGAPVEVANAASLPQPIDPRSIHALQGVLGQASAGTAPISESSQPTAASVAIGLGALWNSLSRSVASSELLARLTVVPAGAAVAETAPATTLPAQTTASFVIVPRKSADVLAALAATTPAPVIAPSVTASQESPVVAPVLALPPAQAAVDPAVQVPVKAAAPAPVAPTAPIHSVVPVTEKPAPANVAPEAGAHDGGTSSRDGEDEDADHHSRHASEHEDD